MMKMIVKMMIIMMTMLMMAMIIVLLMMITMMTMMIISISPLPSSPMFPTWGPPHRNPVMKVDRHGGIQNPFQIIQKIILYLKIFKFNSIKYLKSFLPPVFPPQPQARFPFPFFFGFFTFVHIAFSSSHRFYIEFDVHFFFITLNLVWFSFSHTRLRSI